MIKLEIWGREFELELTYQNYPGEEVTDMQRETVERIKDADYDGGKDAVEHYLLTEEPGEFPDGEIDNIFRYVMPVCILVSRDDEKRVFALMCNYRFDIEHGLALVFENETVKDTGPQDIIL